MSDMVSAPAPHGAEGGTRVAVRWRSEGEGHSSASLAARLNEGGDPHWSALRREFEGMRVRPLFSSVAPERIDALVRAARERDPDYVPGDFHAWLEVSVPVSHEPHRMAARLVASPRAVAAYELRPGPPPAVQPADDPRNPNQGYLDPAPDGIDARYAWGFPGGDGAGIGFVDVEQGWNLKHEDLAAAGVTIISGTNQAYFFHGTSVLGEVLMVDNARGGVGIAPSCSGRVVSQHRVGGGYNTADAILDAVAHMSFGDVLLLEAQEYSPVNNTYYWPVEIADATYEAIRLATALGIVVIEAGCNGSYDLDAYVDPSGKKIFDRASNDFRDSGAIMVGAGSSAAPHARLGFSNYGSRVDCYAWGEHIDTTSTDDAGTDNTLYTTGFNGTSGASPIVTGAAILVQSLAVAALGYRFSPRELRAILKAHGTASATPATDRIGVMPNLRAIIDGNHLALAPDLYLRDHVGDTGDPTSGSLSQSPDIIVKQVAVASPQTAYGPGSGTENNAGLSDPVVAGQDHHLYVRVLNRGGSTATTATVDLYWSQPSTLVSPNLWNHIGKVTLPSVATGSVLTVSQALTWPAAAVPATGHYCFVAIVGNAADPAPTPATFATWDQYVSYVANNNNVVWRNFDVVAPPPSTESKSNRYRQLLHVAGAFDRGRVFTLESVGRLPMGARVLLRVPAALAKSLGGRHCEFEFEPGRRWARIPLPPRGTQALGRVLLRARALLPCEVLIEIPRDRGGHAYEFAIRQLYEGREVGRVTWRFATPRHD